jgi:NAD kinase
MYSLSILSPIIRPLYSLSILSPVFTFHLNVIRIIGLKMESEYRGRIIGPKIESEYRGRII